MTSLDRYVAERRICRRLCAASTYPSTDMDPAVVARDEHVERAARAAHADGYSPEQLIAAETADRLND